MYLQPRAMQRRNFPSILLYGFGLALALSLLFNGFLLYEQSHPQSFYEDEPDNTARSVDHVAWQQRLSECQRANQQKDSLIRQLEQVPMTTSGRAVTVQHSYLK
jgi:hypothetical protein